MRGVREDQNMNNGYWQRALRIDLTERKTEVQPIETADLRRFCRLKDIRLVEGSDPMSMHQAMAATPRSLRARQPIDLRHRPVPGAGGAGRGQV